MRVGATTPRRPGGYVSIGRAHWAFEGMDLYYGDMFGQETKIYSYEVDGADYELRSGQPLVTYKDGAPPTWKL